MKAVVNLSLSFLLTSVLVGCGAEGLTDDEEREVEEEPPTMPGEITEDTPIEEIQPGLVPEERMEEYLEYFEETRHLRSPIGYTFEYRLISEQGEDVSLMHINEEGQIVVLNYLGDAVDAGEDCYALPASYTPNAGLHGATVEGTLDSGFSVEIAPRAYEPEYELMWQHDQYGIIENIILYDAERNVVAESGSVDGVLEADIELRGWNNKIVFEMEPVDYDMELVMEKQCQPVVSALYQGAAEPLDEDWTYDYTIVTSTDIGGRMIDEVPTTAWVGFIDFLEDQQCYDVALGISYRHDSPGNTEAEGAVWTSLDTSFPTLHLKEDGTLGDTETFGNENTFPLDDGLYQEVVNNLCND